MPLDLSRMESIKWLAFVAMVADHVDLLLFARSVPLLHELGRFAFPVFALTFGIGLARTTDVLHSALSLVVAGFLAQGLWEVARGAQYANVLLVFAACSAVASCARAGLVASALCLVVVGSLVSLGGEGGALGLVMVGAGFIAGGRSLTSRECRAVLLAAGAAWCLAHPSIGAACAVVLVSAAGAWMPTVRRVRYALLIGYPLHLGLLCGVAAYGRVS